jgi:hypothetical protein
MIGYNLSQPTGIESYMIDPPVVVGAIVVLDAGVPPQAGSLSIRILPLAKTDVVPSQCEMNPAAFAGAMIDSITGFVQLAGSMTAIIAPPVTRPAFRTRSLREILSFMTDSRPHKK